MTRVIQVGTIDNDHLNDKEGDCCVKWNRTCWQTRCNNSDYVHCQIINRYDTAQVSITLAPWCLHIKADIARIMNGRDNQERTEELYSVYLSHLNIIYSTGVTVAQGARRLNSPVVRGLLLRLGFQIRLILCERDPKAKRHSIGGNLLLPQHTV